MMMVHLAVVAALLTAVAASITCPDGQQCPDGSTCCLTGEQGYGCCPLPAAVCCSDREHCCPSGTVCDVAHGKCQKGDISLPWVQKTPTYSPQNKQCPDGTSCGDDATCCPLASGLYGCCSMENAVCCSDLVHCCPENTMCDVTHGKCVHGKLSFPWMSKNPSKPATSVVQCDPQVSCPDLTTCCQRLSGEWGCCPIPKAVCCDDHEHCCPHATTCNLTAQTCDQGALSVPWSTKTPAFGVAAEPNNVQCDEAISCPDQTTCCKMPSGDWGCCPLPKAVCCSDHLHCCPEGTTCNVPVSRCDKGILSVPWSTKIPARRVAAEPNLVICDDKFKCPNGNTCCKTLIGDWACCPLTQAVCCDDHEHCCPNGTTCNLPAQTCDQDALSVPWSTKTPALGVAAEPNNVQCDETVSCPDQTTCCKMQSGDWGCCPLEKAVCCDDDHCCPEGTTCNVEAGMCDREQLSLPWSSKTPATMRLTVMLASSAVAKSAGVVWCDQKNSCPDGSTCCLQRVQGQWGCCPLPQAVCCSDDLHCCPGGYTCDLSQASCVKKKARFLTWAPKAPAKARPAQGFDLL